MKTIFVCLCLFAGCGKIDQPIVDHKPPWASHMDSIFAEAKANDDSVRRAQYQEYMEASRQEFRVSTWTNNVKDTIYCAEEFTGWDYGPPNVIWERIKGSQNFKSRRVALRFIQILKEERKNLRDHEFHRIEP